MPVCNKMQFLPKAFDSIKRQGLEDYEVIVVENGSTDQSLQILNEIASEDSRVHVIVSEQKGVSKARNEGLRRAAGKWIQFLDADDYFDDGYLRKAIHTAEDNHVDLLFSNCKKVRSDGSIESNVAIQESGIADQNKLCQLFIKYQYQNGFFGFISNKLINRGLIEESGAIFPESITLAEDLDFYAHLYPYVKKAYFWPQNSFNYLQTDENYMYRREIDYFSQMRINLHIIDWFQQSGLYESNKKILDQRITEYAYAILFDSNERNTNLREAYDYLVAEDSIYYRLRIKEISGFKRLVITALIHKNYLCISALFYFRNTIRRLRRSRS